jgi:hypothetical protein
LEEAFQAEAILFALRFSDLGRDFPLPPVGPAVLQLVEGLEKAHFAGGRKIPF